MALQFLFGLVFLFSTAISAMDFNPAEIKEIRKKELPTATSYTAHLVNGNKICALLYNNNGIQVFYMIYTGCNTFSFRGPLSDDCYYILKNIYEQHPTKRE